MLDNEEVKEYLSQIESIEVDIECDLEDQRMYYELGEKITANLSCERVQSSGSPSKLSDSVVKCMSKGDDISAGVDKLIAKKDEIVSVIKSVKNPTLRKLLHQKYCQHKELKVIADNFNASYDWAKKAHQRALSCVAEIINER
jgi:hypothetical protein